MNEHTRSYGVVYEGFYRHWKNGDVYYVIGVGTLDEHGHGNISVPRIVTYKSVQSCNEDGMLRHHWEKDFVKDMVRENGEKCQRFTRIK